MRKRIDATFQISKKKWIWTDKWTELTKMDKRAVNKQRIKNKTGSMTHDEALNFSVQEDPRLNMLSIHFFDIELKSLPLRVATLKRMKNIVNSY